MMCTAGEGKSLRSGVIRGRLYAYHVRSPSTPPPHLPRISGVLFPLYAPLPPHL